MMVKLIKRTPTLINVIAYLFFSLVFLSTVNALNIGVSAVASEFQIDFYNANTWLIGLCLFTIITIYRGLKLSVYLVSAYFLIILGLLINEYLVNYNKVILILIFIFLVTSYILLSAWKDELTKSYYVPNYSRNTIGRKSSLAFNVEVFDENNQFIGNGYLTNLDETSFFCNFDDQLQLRTGAYKFKIFFEEHIFECFAQSISRYGNGFGFSILQRKEKSDVPKWLDFYAIILDRGLIND